MKPDMYWGSVFIIMFIVLLRWLSHQRLTGDWVESFLSSRKPSGVDSLLTIYKVKWCRHCKALIPTVDSLQERLKEHPIPGFSLEVVDCDDDRRLCREAGVQSFPTLLISPGGEGVPFPLPGHVDRTSVDSVYQYLLSLHRAK